MTWPDGAGIEPLDLATVLQESGDDTFGKFRLIAQKFARPEPFSQLEPDLFGRRLAGARPGAARLGALMLHFLVEATRR